MDNLTGIQLPDYLVIFSYFALMIFIGVYFSRYIKMAKDFFAAGNIMPWWLAGTSFYMASFSTLLFVIYNEISYKYGFVAVTICWIGPVCILIGGYFTAHRWRRARILTPISFMERRYNKTVHQIFVWTGFPLRMFDNALKIY
jgi:Na+/proline symporter